MGGDSAGRFTFRFVPSYQAAARVFGVTPERAWVAIEPDELDVHFGPWRVRTPLANITGVEITGPYWFVKTAGPARLGITDRSLTFATNGDRGVCIAFASPVRGIDPFGVLRHPNLTVTVADVEGLASALERQIVAS
jgi:hypothetical protein